MVSQKQLEIQSQLNAWVRQSGLFSVGDVVRIALTLEEGPVTTVSKMGEVHMHEIVSDTIYYRYVTTSLLDEDWFQLLNAGLPTKMLEAVKHLQSVGNVATQLQSSGYRGNDKKPNFNLKLRQLGLKFQLIRVGWVKFSDPLSSPRRASLYRLYKIEPKDRVKKHWKR